MEEGSPATVTIVGGEPVETIDVLLNEGLGSGVVEVYPVPNSVNVPLDTVVSITFDDMVPNNDGDPELEIILWPSPISASADSISQDGYTLFKHVSLDPDVTYQVFASMDEAMPLLYVFGTGSALNMAFIAGQLRFEAGDNVLTAIHVD